MKVDLSDKELEIIECMARDWDENDGGLYGGLSPKMAYDLLKKLKVEIPINLTMLCDDEEEYVAKMEKLSNEI